MKRSVNKTGKEENRIEKSAQLEMGSYEGIIEPK